MPPINLSKVKLTTVDSCTEFDYENDSRGEIVEFIAAQEDTSDVSW